MIAVAFEQPDLPKDWIKANLWCALLIVAAGLAGEAIDEDYRGLAFTMYVLSLDVAAAACCAVLIGQVLQKFLPAFPMRAWVALHATMAALFSLVASASSGQSREGPHLSGAVDELLFVLAGGFLIGAAIGALLGALQAIVLRWCARGLKRWIGMSALGYGLTGIILIFAAGAFRWQSDVVSWLMAAGMGVVIVMAVAFVMLPAVKRLRPIDGADTVSHPAVG